MSTKNLRTGEVSMEYPYKPSVSVIIPSYNRANFVTKAIDSVLSQTYKNYEIIVVDDGSTDNTKKILEQYKYIIRYIYQDNSGVSAARNTGIRTSRGKWIAFLDSDDTWLPEKLAYQMEYINRTGAKVCFTNFFFKDEHGQKIAHGEGIWDNPIKIEPLQLLMEKEMYLQTILVDRTLLDRVGYFDENLVVSEDTQIIYRLAFETPIFSYIKKPMGVVERSKGREGLAEFNGKTLRIHILTVVSILYEAYARCDKSNELTVKMLRKKLGYHLSRKAEMFCVDNNINNARRTAIDALYFGGNLKMRLRCLLIWCFPSIFRLRSKNKYE